MENPRNLIRCAWFQRLTTAAVVFALASCSMPDSVPADAGQLFTGQTIEPTNQVPVEVLVNEQPVQSTQEIEEFEPTGTATTNQVSTQEPTKEPTAEPTRMPPAPVIVISFDGAPNRLVNKWMQAGLLPTFASLSQQGLHAELMRTIDPSLTAAAHASMVTGQYPSKTGIVNNLYHNPADSIYWYRSGFSQPLDQVEPVWVSASRAGLTTASLFIAGGTPFLPGQTADLTVAYGTRLAYSNFESLQLEPVKEEWEGEIPDSYSLPMEGVWMIPKVAQVYIYAYDSLDDGLNVYDSVLVNTARVADDVAAKLETGKWAPLELDPAKRAGAHFLLQSIESANGKVTIDLFHTGVNHNLATPRDLLEAVNEEFGFFPAPADSYALEHGWITPDQFLEMLERSTQWMAQVTIWVMQNYQPDLTFTWLDAFDVSGHAFYPGTPEHPGYNYELEIDRASYYQKAAVLADQALQSITQSVPLSEATYLLVSDHGMAPVHTTVNLNTILEEAGWLVLDDRDYVVVDQTRAITFASGGSANFYINLVGRDQDGIVPEEEYLPLRTEIVEALRSLHHPDTGEPVFSRILVKEELADLNLNHVHSGDIFAQAYPGFNLDSHRGYYGIYQPTKFNGQHGYDCNLPEMEAIFIATGAGIQVENTAIDPVHITDLVSTIFHLLEIPAPGGLPGVNILDALTKP